MLSQKKLITLLLASGTLASISNTAHAHWSSGPFLYNDTGTNPMHLASSELNNPNTGTSYGTYSQTRTGGTSYGWIQATDPSLWGNSHDNDGLAFSLAQTSKVTFTISTLGTATQAVETGSTSAADISGIDWTPSFSIYKGFAAQSSHEGAGAGNAVLAANTPGFVQWGPYGSAQPYTAATDATYEATTGNTYTGNGTWGNFRSTSDWVSGRDISATATFKDGTPIGTDPSLGGNNTTLLEYVTHLQGEDGSHTITGTFTLAAGDYSLWVGGTNAADALQQQANYQGLFNANATDGAAYAQAGATYQNYVDTSGNAALIAAQDAYDAVMASHSATQADRDAALATLTAELDADAANGGDALTLRTAMLDAGQNIIFYTDAIAHLRAKEGYTIQTTVSAVPVPGAVWLFGSALMGLIGVGQRKAKTTG
ncbi:hypothetical protein [Methylomonas methanica]|uniref:Secreted protein n=1 Tax=Methylomonas methanica (strain DSM 25384 / MC09) TaxID=857087 RepID=F9ZZ37_METMM|nr:hypothetical protein [Methylomonas methanica]AEF99892.1 protein of unknown function DUF1555 [Methylomonas methanica MC09]